jgi:hypothetical protein
MKTGCLSGQTPDTRQRLTGRRQLLKRGGLLKPFVVLAFCLSTALLASTASTQASDPAGFMFLKASDLAARNEALSKGVGADHSSRETLASFSDHRFRMLYRDADGKPEQHDSIIDVAIVQSGSGSLLLGGTMEGRSPLGSGVGEWVGTSLDGGERYPLGPGDIVHIPAGIPHSFLVDPGTHLTYVLLKIPAK